MVARGGAVGGGQSACQELDVPLGHFAFDDMRVRSAWAHRVEPGPGLEDRQLRRADHDSDHLDDHDKPSVSWASTSS
jgi:hypothetical protein